MAQVFNLKKQRNKTFKRKMENKMKYFTKFCMNTFFSFPL